MVVRGHWSVRRVACVRAGLRGRAALFVAGLALRMDSVEVEESGMDGASFHWLRSFLFYGKERAIRGPRYRNRLFSPT